MKIRQTFLKVFPVTSKGSRHGNTGSRATCLICVSNRCHRRGSTSVEGSLSGVPGCNLPGRPEHRFAGTVTDGPPAETRLGPGTATVPGNILLRE